MNRKLVIVLSALWLVTVLITLQPGILYGTPQYPRPSPDYPVMAMLSVGACLALFSGYIGITEIGNEQAAEV
jgi:hypothetical protein